ncbi:hypothetical protein [Rhodoferax antarcticus]|uniref:hypothetical protein n=1 Tax=Rhodoferax antarcticus TaxID=81479 RepID=UPI00094F673E|nr:hypothetical protein [Rhodoferax antarcticus]
MYRIYLRDEQMQVHNKTATHHRDAAAVAFDELVNRSDLDGSHMFAVISYDGAPVAHHDFRLRPDGSPHDPNRYWRGRLDQIAWKKT